jgi:hypothetical protein
MGPRRAERCASGACGATAERGSGPDPWHPRPPTARPRAGRRRARSQRDRGSAAQARSTWAPPTRCWRVRLRWGVRWGGRVLRAPAGRHFSRTEREQHVSTTRVPSTNVSTTRVPSTHVVSLSERIGQESKGGGGRTEAICATARRRAAPCAPMRAYNWAPCSARTRLRGVRRAHRPAQRGAGPAILVKPGSGEWE